VQQPLGLPLDIAPRYAERENQLNDFVVNKAAKFAFQKAFPQTFSVAVMFFIKHPEKAQAEDKNFHKDFVLYLGVIFCKIPPDGR
jgi:hypothetical protein